MRRHTAPAPTATASSASIIAAGSSARSAACVSFTAPARSCSSTTAARRCRIVDATTGELRQAQVFVAVLGASSYTYAEATWTQELPQWIASHQRAFAFFGGVVALLVPDNLRSGVTKACRYDPEPNATYQELARHYGKARLEAACERALAIHSPSYRSLATSSSRGSIASPWPSKRPSRGSCPCTPMSAVPAITTDSPPSRGTHHVASAHPG